MGIDELAGVMSDEKPLRASTQRYAIYLTNRQGRQER